MAVFDQVVTDDYAIYCGDACELLPTLPSASIHLSIYSPPFATERGGALYHYSSSDRDLSNARTYAEFMEHYRFVVAELARITLPGRSSLVHCIDVPNSNSGDDDLTDFPGDIIRLHREEGWRYKGRYHVWKEPLAVRNRTMTKGLAHATVVTDASRCSVASADYLLRFQRRGKGGAPVPHPNGFMEYYGAREMPRELMAYRGWTGEQTENLYSHWIWRRYADAFWDDIRLDRVLPFKEARDEEDEKHVHPLQLDVIDRGLILWSNPGETVFTPCMGVGSEVHEAVRLGRRAIGVELKASYFRQSVKNMAAVKRVEAEQLTLA